MKETKNCPNRSSKGKPRGKFYYVLLKKIKLIKSTTNVKRKIRPMGEQHWYEDRNAPMTARRKKNSKEV